VNTIPIFDGHNDTVHLLREYKPDGIDFLATNATGHLDLPRAEQGGMFGGLFAMYVRTEYPETDNLTVTEAGWEVRMAEPLDHTYALRETSAELAALKSLAERSEGQLRICTNVDQIEAARLADAFAIVLHIEGAEAIGTELSELETLYAEGLRSIGPVWSRPNIFGHGVPFAFPRSPDTGPGLTPTGKDLVRECNRLGIQVDLAHLNERGFWDVAAITTAPIVVSHTCVHAISATARNLTDRQLDAIQESDGLVGVNLCVNDLRPDAHKDPDTPLEMVVRHFAYLVDRIGIDRVALGSDFDGATIPAPIGDARGLQNLIAALRSHGFDDRSLRKLAYENWMRVLSLSLRVS
jgi:membrane dipeptidase